MEPLDWQKAGFEPHHRRRADPDDTPVPFPMDAGVPTDDWEHGDLFTTTLKANLSTAPERLGSAAKASAPDMVVMPAHYARFKIEPIRFIGENHLDWFQGNIIKYVCRHDAKNGLEDIAKVKRYAAMYERFLMDDPDWWTSGKPEDFRNG